LIDAKNKAKFKSLKFKSIDNAYYAGLEGTALNLFVRIILLHRFYFLLFLLLPKSSSFYYIIIVFSRKIFFR